MEGQVEGNFQSVQLVRPGEVDGVEPAAQGRQAVLNHVARQVPRRGVLEMGHQAPHGRCRRLQLRRKCGVVGVRLELYVGLHLAGVDVHALEHGEEVEPHEQLLLVLHEFVGDGGVGQDVVQIGHQRPVAVILTIEQSVPSNHYTGRVSFITGFSGSDPAFLADPDSGTMSDPEPDKRNRIRNTGKRLDPIFFYKLLILVFRG